MQSLRFEGAVIKEQGVTFAIVVVRKSVIDNRPQAQSTILAFQEQVFPGIPVVLMAQDIRGAPIYYGRHDISRFMAGVPLSAVRWMEYSVNL
jgi:hypothetical protein